MKSYISSVIFEQNNEMEDNYVNEIASGIIQNFARADRIRMGCAGTEEIAVFKKWLSACPFNSACLLACIDSVRHVTMGELWTDEMKNAVKNVIFNIDKIEIAAMEERVKNYNQQYTCINGIINSLDKVSIIGGIRALSVLTKSNLEELLNMVAGQTCFLRDRHPIHYIDLSKLDEFIIDKVNEDGEIETDRTAVIFLNCVLKQLGKSKYYIDLPIHEDIIIPTLVYPYSKFSYFKSIADMVTDKELEDCIMPEMRKS